MNDDLLMQAINKIDLGEDAVGSCEASLYHVSVGTPTLLKLPEKIKFLTNVADNCISQMIKGQQELLLWENQDGGLGRHTAPPPTTRTDRKLNDQEVQHQGDKK